MDENQTAAPERANSSKMWLYVAAIAAVAALAAFLVWGGAGGQPSVAGPENEEHAGVAGPSAEEQAPEVEAGLVGEWRSTQDPNFTRAFRADGTVVDRYEGEPAASASGTWTVFTEATAPAGVAIPLNAAGVYLLMNVEGDVLHFQVANVTATELELVYLDRGGVLVFTRVQ
ncbi:hypothetical protein COU20_03060 [Candidatus Kaiserbacteria bacterium CG10_big_fil_rev_8_21_14_0_10_59_10]|uniref:Uncharacterized protein n=1 Tax=Candidatus Kaiserbacteria bacterium CG10_big_fil_rev_8_21_14_0_10_59_10 TaxID=1974612 RepID=A0A2H0U974_9BACT|nr:MAG: hypothetical protein COU20_03060 [Candidatus Kaiserbacteria bacterium CG10_big_fil_rev_8_21_14_0_10_59_10]